MDEIKKLIARTEELFEKEQYDEIIGLLHDELLDRLNNEALYAWRAWAHNRLEETDKAFNYANRAIKTDPNSYSGYRQRGIAWSEKKEDDKAIEDYDKAVEIKNDYAEAYNSRGVSWAMKGEIEKALTDYNRAIELKPNYAVAYNNLGIGWTKNNENDKAIAAYDRAIELKPDYFDAYNNRGISWDNKEEYDKAIADYKRSIELKPDFAVPYNNLGIVWSKKGEYEKAIPCYSEVIKLDPNFADAYNNRGVSWFEKGEKEKAIADFNKAIELKQNFALPFRNRGDVYYSEGEFQKAIDDYEVAIKIDKNKFNFLDYYIKLAKEKLEEEKSLESSIAEESDKKIRKKLELKIEKLISTIRTAAKSDVKTVVHYTKVFVADIYVKGIDAKMQYSNAIYMNDPMEGKVLFDYLDDKDIEEAYRFGEKRTETSVYLGSFLPAEENDGEVSHEDELVMWRTYGKDENGKEAAGCNVVLSSDFFKAKKNPTDSIAEKIINKEELLNVVYIKAFKERKEIADDSNNKIKNTLEKLKKSLKDLLDLRKKYENDKKSDFYRDIENIVFKQLSTISYLFKSADYHFEREVRVITYMPRDSDSIKFREQKESGCPCKRFYIESENSILPYIKKIFLGPKVENYHQWSLYFDYELRQRAKELDAMSSAPYKIKPSDIEVMKSECKFQ